VNPTALSTRISSLYLTMIFRASLVLFLATLATAVARPGRDLKGMAPSEAPSEEPTLVLGLLPEESTSDVPTETPSDYPSDAPSDSPSDAPSDSPSDAPSDVPSTSPVAVPPPTESPVATPTEPPVSEYNIQLELLMSEEDASFFGAAAARWEDIITIDLESVAGQDLIDAMIFPPEGCTYPELIDGKWL